MARIDPVRCLTILLLASLVAGSGCTLQHDRGKPGQPPDRPQPMEPEVQLRVLEALNQAHRPEDLIEIDPEVFPRGVAQKILARRDALPGFRYTELGQLFELNPAIRDRLAAAFGPSRRGRWVLLPYNVQKPDGSMFSTAHAAMLRTGEVLFLPRSDTLETVLWDPADEAAPDFQFPAVQPSERLFCSGHSFLADGRLLAVGGGGNFSSNAIDSGWLFDPVSRVWTRSADSMSDRRWYPTAVTLGDGRVFVASGYNRDTVDVYDPASDDFIPVGGPPANPTGANRSFPETYPGLHLLPDGRIVFSRTGWHGPNDATLNASLFEFSGSSQGEWTDVTWPMNAPDRTEGMSVLLLDGFSPDVRMMVIGGGDPATSGRTSAETLDFSFSPPRWGHPSFLPDSRVHVNAVLMPDGQVLVVGGRDVQSSPSLMFDPSSGGWSQMAQVKYRREYHSVALLLPSGKVMTTGGDDGNTPSQRTTLEIFSPPYLFKGPRPVIVEAPDSIRYGESFKLEPASMDVAKVVLVRPMAVTHHTDSEQRVLELPFSLVPPVRKQLTVEVPGGAHASNLAPPGYYMLFILNRRGALSEAKFVRLDRNPY